MEDQQNLRPFPPKRTVKKSILLTHFIVHSALMKTVVGVFMSCILSFAGVGQSSDNIQWGEKFNSTGASLILKESGRSRINGHTVVTYNAFASGLPKGKDYKLWGKLVASNPQTIADAYIDKDGLVVSVLSDPNHGIAEDPINIKVYAGPGEPKQFALIANDGSYQAFSQVVPFPVEKTVGSCKISATMRMPNYLLVSVDVHGLQPKEEFQIDHQSGNERGRTKEMARDDGTYTTLLFPAVKGQSSGKFHFNLTAKSCTIGLEMPWGEGSYIIQ